MIAPISVLIRMTFTFSFLLDYFFMKVLSEYPEAKMTTEQQNASLGETYPELVKRLDEGIFIIMSCRMQKTEGIEVKKKMLGKHMKTIS